MSTEPGKQLSAAAQGIVTLQNTINGMANEFQRSLPPSVPAAKFVRTILTAIQMNPDLAVATPQSVKVACMKAASDGLILDGREAALTIYNTKKKDRAGNEVWEKVAQYIPMVTGIIKRVRNSGEVSRFNSFVVHEGDNFEVQYGLEMSLQHKPNFDNPGKIKGVYAICRFKDGEDDFEYMTVKQVEEIRARSKAKDSGPWKTDYEEMCRKTVMRRLAKRLPMDSDIRNVVTRVDELYEDDREDENDGGSLIDQSTGEVLHDGPAKPKRTRTPKASGAAAEKVAQQEATQATGQPTHTAAANNAPAGNVVDASYEEMERGAPANDESDHRNHPDDQLADDVI